MNSKEYEALRRELDTLLAIQVGQTALLAALMQTHPRYDDLQLAATTALEAMLGKTPEPALSESMKDKARFFVEELQRLKAAAPGTIGPSFTTGL